MGNNTYEFVIPYEEINEYMKQEVNADEEEVLNKLKEAELHSISLEPDTLESLEANGLISILDNEEMRKYLLLGGKDVSDMTLSDKEGVYVHLGSAPTIVKKIAQIFPDAEKMHVHDHTFYFIPGNEVEIKQLPIGYNEEVVNSIKSHGFQLIPRLPNEIYKENEMVIDQLLHIKDNQVNGILFTGRDVVGFPDHQVIKERSQQFKNRDYSVYSIEFSDQRGFATVANVLNFHVIRLHSINLDNDEEMDIHVERVVRAVKERNIRTIFMRLNKEKEEDSLAHVIQFMEQVREEMPNMFQPGVAESFSTLKVSKWQTASALVAGIIFTVIAALSILNRRLAIVAFILSTLLAVAYLGTSMSMFLKLFALAIAIITPIYAVIPKKTTDINKKRILLSYGRAAFISFLGIWIIVALLIGNQYLVQIDTFRGVKLVYIVPILFMVIYAMWGKIKRILHLNIRFWHLGVFFIGGIVAYYYLSRTGNAGAVSSVELAARQALEKLLYVRPRTKEFLIGFPFYILALYVFQRSTMLGKILLIPGVIGFLSLVNTFTHLHIPLYISLLRSLYSLLVGLAVGFVFIFIYRIIVKYVKVLRMGWQR